MGLPVDVRLLSTLRRVKPARITLRSDDGTTRDVALRSHGGRWEHAAEVIVDAQATDSGLVAELLDKEGRVLHVVRARDVAADPPPLPAAPAVSVDLAVPLERLLELMLKAQNNAVDRQLAGLRDVLAGHKTLVDSMAARLGAFERTYGQMLKSMHDATVAVAEAKAHAATADAAERDSPADALLARLAPMLGLPDDDGPPTSNGTPQ